MESLGSIRLAFRKLGEREDDRSLGLIVVLKLVLLVF